MTWSVNMSGNLADPGEEAKVLEKAREFVASLADIPQSLTGAQFSGTYTPYTDLMPKDADGSEEEDA